MKAVRLAICNEFLLEVTSRPEAVRFRPALAVRFTELRLANEPRFANKSAKFNRDAWRRRILRCSWWP